MGYHEFSRNRRIVTDAFPRSLGTEPKNCESWFLFQSNFTVSYLWVSCMEFLRQFALWWAWEDTCTCRKDHHGLDWYTPSNQVSAQSKWPTVKDLYEYRLLMLAQLFTCSYYSMKLFTKYVCNFNLGRKLTFLLQKPNIKVSCKSTCYKAVSISMEFSWQSHTDTISSKSLFKKSLKRRTSCE